MIKCNYFILFTFISLISIHYAWLNSHHHYHSWISKNSHRNSHVLTSSSISKVLPSYRLQRSQQSVNDNNNESSEKPSSTASTSTGMVLHLITVIVLFMTMFIACINLFLFLKVHVVHSYHKCIISYNTSFNIIIVIIFIVIIIIIMVIVIVIIKVMTLRYLD